MQTIDYYNDEEFSRNFLKVSQTFFSNIENNNPADSLKRIKVNKLRRIAEDLDSFSSSNEVHNEKKLFIKYLKKIDSRPINEFSLQDLIVLKRDYIRPIVDGKLGEIGWVRRYGWILAALFVLPIDLFLIALMGKYYFFGFPVLMTFVAVRRFIAQRQAKKENKLW